MDTKRVAERVWNALPVLLVGLLCAALGVPPLCGAIGVGIYFHLKGEDHARNDVDSTK